jgi:hypothetical protein
VLTPSTKTPIVTGKCIVVTDESKDSEVEGKKINNSVSLVIIIKFN